SEPRRPVMRMAPQPALKPAALNDIRRQAAVEENLRQVQHRLKRMVRGDNRRKHLHPERDMRDRAPRERRFRRQHYQGDDAAGGGDYHQGSSANDASCADILADPMSESHPPSDRTALLASLRDYVEQLREEGMDGLPASESRPVAQVAAAVATTIAAEPERPSGTLPPPPPQAMEMFSRYPGLEKTSTLEQLREFIGDCRRCKLWPMRTNLVFGVGNPNAELMFVGEAPGADEDARGEPFVGRAGQLLTDIIERGMGMPRSEVYICNVIKCRPPGNRNPEPDEVSSCEPFLWRQLELVKPRVIVGLGTFAVQA